MRGFMLAALWLVPAGVVAAVSRDGVLSIVANQAVALPIEESWLEYEPRALLEARRNAHRCSILALPRWMAKAMDKWKSLRGLGLDHAL